MARDIPVIGGDEELEEILRRKAKELAMREAEHGAKHCCIPIEPGYELRDSRHLRDLLSKCPTVFVMFYGVTCPVCRAFDPVFRKVGQKYVGRAAFVKLEVSNAMDLVYSLGISGTPTTVVFVDGKPEDALIGYANAAAFENFVRVYLKC